MSRRRGRGDVGEAGDPHPRGGPHPPVPVPIPVPGRVKRRKTKRERDSAKFGRKIPGGFRWGAGPPPRRLLPPWGGRPAASPLPLPKTVVITQNRLCQHRGMFNREVKSVDVERLLSPRDAAPHDDTPEGDPEPGPPDPPPSQGVPAELAGRLRALLGGTRMFSGRDLVGERRGAILAALLRRHRSLPDLGLLLAHRRWGADAAPPGPWSPQTPERAPRGSAEGGDFGGQKQSWDPTPPSGSTPAPLRAFVSRTPSPIFGGDGKKRETPFSWSSGEEEEEEEEEDGGCPDSPAPLFQPHTPSWGDPRWHGGALPGSPPLRARGGPPFAPRPTPAPFGEGRSWSHRPPIAPPAFGPLPPRLGQPPAPRHPDPRRGGNPHPPRTPDRWSPEPSCHAGFVPGWPCAQRRAPRCHRDPCRRRGPRRPSPAPCCWQPSPERGPPPENRRWWDWGHWWEAGGRGGRGEPGWLRALRRLPLSCFPPALGGDGSPPPAPGGWGCPCAGLY